MNSLLHRTCAFTSAVVATLAIVAAVGSTTAPASAAQLGCGAIITTDTTLDSDLTSCPSNGIVIGADDITLDLNSHTVGGDGVPAGPCFDEGVCDLGISNLAGHAGVTITGGAVRGFDVGISVGGSETPIIGIAPAVANALANAVQFRIRSMPIRNEQFRSA